MSDQAEFDEAEPIGWDAIDAALAPIYGKQEPKHYGTILPAMLGGDDPLQGISAYKNLSPQPHFHFVTYGFSELYEKESDDPEYSGFGFELTFRLACGESDEEPPPWPLSFLQNLARYVFSSGNAFDERHHMTLNGPIAIGEETGITAIVLIQDPQLKEMDTRNGHVKFLQIVGLCGDEYELIQEGYFDQIANRVSEIAPLSVTNIYRSSILEDEVVRNEITAEEPKVSQSEVFGTVAEWAESNDQFEVRIGATIVAQLKSLLSGRLAEGDPVAVYGKGTGIVFEPGESVAWRYDEPLLLISLPKEVATHFADNLEPVRGIYQCDSCPNFSISVVPIEIKDGEGSVTDTVG